MSVETACRCTWPHHFDVLASSLKLRQQLSFFDAAQVLNRCHFFMSRHLRRKAKDMLSRCGHFLLVTLVRFKCARIRGLNTSAVYGVDLATEGLEPCHDICMRLWMHHVLNGCLLYFLYLTVPSLPYILFAAG